MPTINKSGRNAKVDQINNWIGDKVLLLYNIVQLLLWSRAAVELGKVIYVASTTSGLAGLTQSYEVVGKSELSPCTVVVCQLALVLMALWAYL